MRLQVGAGYSSSVRIQLTLSPIVKQVGSFVPTSIAISYASLRRLASTHSKLSTFPVLPVPLILGALERAVLCVPPNIFDDIALYIGDSISISVPFAAIVHKFAAAL